MNDGVEVCTYLAHQLPLLLRFPFESWVVAMFPFIILDWRIEFVIAEPFEGHIVL